MSRCPYCSFDPTNLNDFCNEHRPKVRETPAPTPKDAAESPAPGGWQPIETAPKDRELLLYGEKPSGARGMVQGAWNRGGAMHMPHWMGGIREPTHWMPLPSPPGGTDRSPPVSPAREEK